MFWKEKFNGIYEQINTENLKEPQYYIADCGCRKKYAVVTVEVRPNGNLFKVKTTLFRSPTDVMSRAFQPLWDNKKLQKKLKEREMKKKKGYKEKPYKPTKYRKLTQKDYRDLLLAYLTFYKWLKENVKDDYPDFDRIKGTISVLDFAYKGEAEIVNQLHDNDVNTVENVDLTIKGLTMEKKAFRKYFDEWLKRMGKKRDMEVKSVLKGLVCYKCNAPMVETEESSAFNSDGHYMPIHLRGRKCPECNFTIYAPEDVNNYIRDNNFHYIVTENVGGIALTDEMKNMIQARKKSRNEFDKIWEKKHKRDQKVLKDIRISKKRGVTSRFFGTMDEHEKKVL